MIKNDITAVEFFDKAPLKNVISALTVAPKKIFFVGDLTQMERSISAYRSFFSARGIGTEIELCGIRRDKLDDIVAMLCSIVESNDNCVFDLTGGNDLVLVAMGIVFQRYGRERVQMQRLSLEQSKIIDCDMDGRLVSSKTETISVEELVLLHSGAVRSCNRSSAQTEDVDCADDLRKMWRICARNPGIWNTQTGVLGVINSFSRNRNSIEVSFNSARIKDTMRCMKMGYAPIDPLLKALRSNNLISEPIVDGSNVCFSYKNQWVKNTLSAAGSLLEQMVLFCAKSLVGADGSSFYSDACNGVFIDWDGELYGDKKDTVNEIDVILMHGLTPIFISCKNGGVGDDELYKLNSVADRFAVDYAKKVLIATNLGKKSLSLEFFKQRAEDMGIRLLDNVHVMSENELRNQIKKLADY